MSFDSHDIRNLIAQGESSSLEFKLKLPPDNVIAADLSAFANASGGVLIIGVDDKGEIVGLKAREAEEAMEKLFRIASSLFPHPTNIDSVNIDRKTLVYIVVDPVPGYLGPVVTSSGHLYRRQGSTSYRLSALEEEAEFRGSPVAPRPTEVRCRVFVAMSFRTEEEPALTDYYRAIERACDGLSLPIDLKRIDLKEGDYEISQEIMNEIDQCDIVVADFTLAPANVYFEVGYARGSNKVIIQTAREATALEFDVRNWRTAFYRNATELEEKIGPALQAAYARVTGQT